MAGELIRRVADVTIDTLRLTGHHVRFEIEKSIKPEPNSCHVTIWNLTEAQRSHLEELRPKKGQPGGVPVRIEAGYEGQTSLLWLGDLRDVSSVKDGPDWVTELGSGDGEKAYKSARVGVAFGPSTQVDTAIRAIVRALGVSEGNVGQVVQRLRVAGVGKLLSQGVVISGSAARQMTDWARSANLEWSIQDGAIQFTDRGKALLGTAIKLDASTGMVGSPTVDNDGILDVRMLIIPDVRCAGLLLMNAERVKGGYRMLQLHWTGDTHGDDWYIDAKAKRY